MGVKLEDLRQLPIDTKLLFRDGKLTIDVYLADRKPLRCGRVKVRMSPRRGQVWIVYPIHLEKQ